MAPNLEADLAALVRELRVDLRSLGTVRLSIDALANIASDLRDQQIQTRIVAEDTLEVLRELRDAMRAANERARKAG